MFDVTSLTKGKSGADVFHLHSKVGCKLISREGGRRGRGGEGGVKREVNVENSFLGFEAEELILVR